MPYVNHRVHPRQHLQTSSTRPHRRPLAVAIALTLACSPLLAQPPSQDEDGQELEATVVFGTAAEQVKQSLGVSVITREDIERRPPTNDLAELLRTMPGVNLTGNSASGQYGNNRQIDLRGMGPENTLILIDGRPVGSRDSIRMGRSGERNTRGDTNWVPAEMVDRIEVLRGPAAARYGSGASGGVINIVTRKPDDVFRGSVSLYTLHPQHDEEGGGERAGFQLSGPISQDWSFRVYGNLNRTEADSLDLNADYAADPDATPPAGREGVRNRDANALLRWDINEDHVVEIEGGFSRQGNIYAGDRAVSGVGSPILTELANAGIETNRMYRTNGGISHRATWGDKNSRLSFNYEATNNKRLNEGLAGGAEGSITDDTDFSTSRLRNYAINAELDIPFQAGAEHVMTLGFEHRNSDLEDPYSVQGAINWGGSVPGIDPVNQDGKADARLTAFFVEDNIYIGDRWIVTPGLRFDHHSQFGNNLSPSLNAQFNINDDLSLKGGVARAFKAPNLYQSNGNYLYYTMGNGCPFGYTGNQGGGCYVLGNPDLDAETSLNKEIGIEWAPLSGHHASMTYFHNNYKNRIQAGLEEIGRTIADNGGVFQWENTPEAVVSGFEGNLKVPLLGDQGRTLSWNNNLTWMIENKNKETDQPLSIIPKYTLNTSLDWQATDKLALYLNGTFYGKQEPPTQSMIGAPNSGDALNTREAYNLWHLSGRYRFTDTISLGAGINNVLDKRLFRENNSVGAGAATYNEPGRAYFVSLNVGF